MSSSIVARVQASAPDPSTEVLGEDVLLGVRDLHTYFSTDEGLVKAVNGVSFDIKKESVFGVVGESGCGKSITAMSIMQLLPKPHGQIHSGHVFFRQGERGIVDLAQQDPTGSLMRRIRGNEIAMIFQEPMTSLNPVYTVGQQIVEAITLHQKVTEKQAWKMAEEMLAKVGIPIPRQRVREYPYQMSGGMRQRVMIAMALSCNPTLLIADEPTTALDVTIQAQILELMRRLQEEYKMSIMMITHNLGVVSRMCDEVVVMYLGKIVEHAQVRTLFHNPAHPYTVGLLNSIPKLGGRGKRLVPIKGIVPDPRSIPEGCSFRERCPVAMKQCVMDPPVIELEENHAVRCWQFASQSMTERDAQ
ncbi:MAG TPA: ABC transporter ATP-binding protein [Firmicutes bacterium]|jgi:oligopeptide/dipeptide ABC transporter ATP-binding protein|nr:ABC transporter ATP-binding protein [Bacillota bacterium]